MKRAIFLVSVVLACLSLSACAGGPGTQTVSLSIDADTADAAAVKFEGAMYAMVTTIGLVVTDPQADVDPAKFANGLREAAADLDEARALFDKRTGDPTGLTKAAFDLLAQAVPPGSSLKVRLAVSAGRMAVTMFVTSLDLTGPPAPPSQALRDARARTDRAVAKLLSQLPAGSLRVRAWG